MNLTNSPLDSWISTIPELKGKSEMDFLAHTTQVKLKHTNLVDLNVFQGSNKSRISFLERQGLLYCHKTYRSSKQVSKLSIEVQIQKYQVQILSLKPHVELTLRSDYADTANFNIKIHMLKIIHIDMDAFMPLWKLLDPTHLKHFTLWFLHTILGPSLLRILPCTSLRLRSAIRWLKAKKRCPQVIVIEPNFA